MNEAVRVELKEKGVLSSQAETFRTLTKRNDMTGAERTWAARYEVGNILQYTTGSRAEGIAKHSGKEIELTAKQARHIEHGYAIESVRRVSAERFIATGDVAEAKTLKSVPVQGRDLSIHTTTPAVERQKAPKQEKTRQHKQAQ